MAILCYGGVAGYRADEIAPAVGLHLNYLGTGREDIDLGQVTAVLIEDADLAVLRPDLRDLYLQFERLKAANPAVAAAVLRKLIHQGIIATLTYRVFERVKSKLEVLPYKYDDIQENTISIDIATILARKDVYQQIVRKYFGQEGTYFLENDFRRLFKQIVEPRLDDLSISQADLKAGLEEIGTGLEEISTKTDKISTKISTKTDLENTKQELLKAIEALRRP